MRFRLSKTILRNSIIISSVFIAFLLVFDFLLYYLITFQLTSVLDSKISHEIEHILPSFKVVDSSIVIIRPSEFDEKDLVDLYDNSFFLQIYKNDGSILLHSKNIPQFGKIDVNFPSFAAGKYYTDTQTKKELLRSGYKKLFNEKGEQIGLLQLSARKLLLEAALQKILYYNLLILPFILVLVILISIFISKKLVEPINSIINTAGRITALNLSQRLDIDSDPHDEINRLKFTLNDLFERLENQVREISSFADNASHQLMTPLTTIISELDYALQKNNQDVDLKSSLVVAKEQSEKILKIIKSLLIMARIGNNYSHSNFVFSLETIVKNSIKVLYKENNIEYKVDDEIYLRGNSEYFSMVLHNILDNAIKYSGRSSPIVFLASKFEDKVKIIVKDEGIGIPDKEKTKIFERFYRGENAEKIGIKGTGLGISLASAIIRSMKGEIKIEDNKPKGTQVIISLPLV